MLEEHSRVTAAIAQESTHLALSINGSGKSTALSRVTNCGTVDGSAGRRTGWLVGLPAAVVPVGIQDGFPQGVQIIGPPLEAMRCLAAAETIEQQVEALTPIDPR